MGDNRWKPIVFTATVIIAFTLILFIFVHRSNQRDRLCPHPEDLYFIDDASGNGSCHRERTSGPCPLNMILIPSPGNQSVGVCECDFLHNDRGLVYHNESNQCYFIFSQGYCSSPSEWLKPFKDSSCDGNLCATCEPNICTQLHPNTGAQWVQLADGSCAELGRSYRSCPSTSDVIHFTKFKAFPSCEKSRKPLSFRISGIGVPPAKCPPGYSRTRLGHCALDFDFE